MTWRGRGLVPDCLGWLRLVGGLVKALGCKRWVAIRLALLRFPWAAALTRPGRRGRVGVDPLPGSRVAPGPDVEVREAATSPLCRVSRVPGEYPGWRGTKRGAGGDTLLRPQSIPGGTRD
jgi:hypothetical protein